jgi:hypothetical protein
MTEPVDIERIRRVLLDEEVLEHLSNAHTVYEADEDHGGLSDDEEGEEAFKRAADLEYVINWLRPNYIGPAFPADWIAEWRRKKAATEPTS